MRVSVIGCGHLGIPHAAAMAEIGHEVIGVDLDRAKIDRLNAGECPIYEEGLPELLATHTASGRLRFTTSLAEAGEFADVHFLAVGTPIDADGRSYDTGQVFGAARALAPHLTRPAVIIGKSTVTVGTSRDLGALLARLSPAGEDVEVVWNPEFLREGHAIDDTLRPDRIVVGVPSTRAEDVVRQVYAPLLADGIPLLVTDPATAELIKGAANAYLGMKISFINGVADMCAAAGADVQQLTEAIGVDPRIGRGGLNAGPGYGGGCLPKDVRAFTASARTLGATEAATMLRAAEEVNESRPTAALKLIEQTLGRPVDGVRVTVWGASFKAGTNDVRESPALAIAALMQQRGATVTVHDPHAVPSALRRNPELDYADTLDASVQDAELIVLATEWPHFREADPKALAPLVAAPVLVDLRNLIDADAWRMAGWTVRQLGRPAQE
ncbi:MULTISPECIES: UDP-glucose/GDP-mannose dehydrogenase family protein [unclassified Streptomyces]|uniref:UDP-glucose dehydrogenase family protein n=1 Tax=unclassified Streptomyces TaxID=2593676 RepID=UPI002ED28623|nr:UDP-glucose/GDP-mannose dehydrogenase family protein [Streptomyces sp. NBC_00891]WSY06359.1 UDP-glucose/GDP-mannose dehydrogenase family protein [Streptomyces sp. NBC_00890]WSZ07983.1 UDP-glucose/GDP-mannose dehydrogenase family protein [Streptomyces sp. NBC_00869]WSZ24517.1 UDP-glucose/GDP-mannose dehydrogenase family protein [Streptomyces sp. NBC_00870]